MDAELHLRCATHVRALCMEGVRMKRAYVIIAAVLSLAMTFGLAACGGSNDGPTGDSIGFVPRDAAELDAFVADGKALADDLEARTNAEAAESDLETMVAGEFNGGNEAYRAQDYAAAEASYRKVIEEYPTHYGANVNLTLALLQQEKNEEALVQSFACVWMAHDLGPLLNVQAAGTACGFAEADIEHAVEGVAESNGGSSLSDIEKEPDYGVSSQYNSLWNRVETEFGVALAAQDAEEADAKELEKVYLALMDEVDVLVNEYGNEDALELKGYLKAIGEKLGLNTSQAAETSQQGFPATVIDDDYAKLTLNEITSSDAHKRLITYTFKNKSDRELFLRTGDGDWVVNGEHDCQCSGGPAGLSPKGEYAGIFYFTDSSGAEIEDEITSFEGTFSIRDSEDGDPLEMWRVTWSAT